MTTSAAWRLGVWVACAGWAGCASVSGLEDDGQALRLTEGQVVEVLRTAHEIELETARLAVEKSATPQARAFAERMLKDHRELAQETRLVVAQLGLASEDSDISRAWRQSGDDAWAVLQSLEGMAFDRTYANRELEFHDQMLGAIDARLELDAHNLELRRLVQRSRQVLQSHRDHAQQLVEAVRPTPVSRGP